MKRIMVNPYVFSDRVDDLNFDPADKRSKSLTQQHAAGECDVNQIVARALKTGVLGDPVAMASRIATFGDFSSMTDFHSCVNKVIAAQNAFNDMPIDIRVRFNNDPALLIDFLSNENNLEEAVSLGLLPQTALEQKRAADAEAAAEAAELKAQQEAALKAAANPPAA